MWSPHITEEIAAEFEQPSFWEWVVHWGPKAAFVTGQQDGSFSTFTPRHAQRDTGEPCPGCGGPVERPHGWTRTYCSDKCRRDYHNRTSRPRPVRPECCLHCGAAIKQNLGGRVRRFCGPRCARKAHRK